MTLSILIWVPAAFALIAALVPRGLTRWVACVGGFAALGKR